MIKIYKTNLETGKLEKLNNIVPDAWINIENPTKEEISLLTKELDIDANFLNSVLDKEELSRIEDNTDYKAIIINYPYIDINHKNKYNTLPLAIIIKEKLFITITLTNNNILNEYIKNNSLDTAKKTRNVIDILYKIAREYLKCLKLINEEITSKESKLFKSTKNEDLVNLLNIEKSLVYFLNSLKENGVVLEKLSRGTILEMYKEDSELLEDAIIENNQGIEMCNIYREILTSTTDTYATIISNNLNDIMKFLAGITIVFSVPTMIASFMGMNVPLGFLNTNDYAFPLLVAISLVISIIVAIILKKKNML